MLQLLIVLYFNCNITEDGIQQITFMQIFGPLIPIIKADSPSEAIDFINNGERPLAIYVFSNDRSIQQRFIDETYSGGVTCNDVLMHTSS